MFGVQSFGSSGSHTKHAITMVTEHTQIWWHFSRATHPPQQNRTLPSLHSPSWVHFSRGTNTLQDIITTYAYDLKLLCHSARWFKAFVMWPLRLMNQLITATMTQALPQQMPGSSGLPHSPEIISSSIYFDRANQSKICHPYRHN